jgi:competence protein ComEC
LYVKETKKQQNIISLLHTIKLFWSVEYNDEMERRERVRLFSLLFFVFVILLVWLPQVSSGTFLEKKCECLQVSFLDVGQGDSIFIETPDGYQLLVDGGPDMFVLRELGHELSFFDRSIDMIVASHPDADHIAGLSDVLARYDVGSIIETTNGKQTPVTQALATAVEKEHMQVVYAEPGQVIQLGASTTLRIFSPAGDETNWESNMASIVLKVEYGSTSVMLTGDAPIEIENYLVQAYPGLLKSTVLKLGHHGSKTSSSDEWLDAVNPEYAVVSAGLNNKYGHPHASVMQAVAARNIKVDETSKEGTITFYSDGKTMWEK